MHQLSTPENCGTQGSGRAAGGGATYAGTIELLQRSRQCVPFASPGEEGSEGLSHAAIAAQSC